MTDATHTADSSADDAGSLSTVIHRRLIGLIVLLAGLFLASLMLRNTAPSSEALPSVVIPLGNLGSGELRASPAAEPDALEPASSEALTSATARAEAPAATLPAAEQSPAPVEREAVEKPKPRADTAAPKPQAASKPTVPKPAVSKPEAAARWFVGVGAYKDPMAAQAIANRVKLAGFKADVSAVTVNKDKLQRVRAGPFATKAAAESARVTLIVEGLTKAVTLSEK